MSGGLSPEEDAADALRRLSLVNSGLNVCVAQMTDGLIQRQRKEIEELKAEQAKLKAGLSLMRGVVGVAPTAPGGRYLVHNMQPSGLLYPSILLHLESVRLGFQIVFLSERAGAVGYFLGADAESSWCLESVWLQGLNLARGEELRIRLEQEQDGDVNVTTYSPDDITQRAESNRHVMMTHGTKISVLCCKTNDGTVQKISLRRAIEWGNEEPVSFQDMVFWISTVEPGPL